MKRERKITGTESCLQLFLAREREREREREMCWCGKGLGQYEVIGPETRLIFYLGPRIEVPPQIRFGKI